MAASSAPSRWNYLQELVHPTGTRTWKDQDSYLQQKQTTQAPRATNAQQDGPAKKNNYNQHLDIAIVVEHHTLLPCITPGQASPPEVVPPPVKFLPKLLPLPYAMSVTSQNFHFRI
jgi:hypothetical protein